MHILGLQGQPRRMYLYDENMVGSGIFTLSFWNFMATVGAFILAVGVLLFVVNVVRTTWFTTARAPLDPWDARSYEWMTTNPPKEHNFDSIPAVHSLDEFFHRKYEEDDEGRLTKVASAEDVLADLEAHADEHIHMPDKSYWPLVVAAGLPLIALGLIYTYILCAVGGVLVVLGAYGWAQEPATADPEDFEPPSGPSQELATVG
jgi:cytochrome c oxidase subunit 1